MIPQWCISLLSAISLFCSSPASAQGPTLPRLKPNDPIPINLFVELNKLVNPAVVNIFTTYVPQGRRSYRDPQDPFFDLFEQFMNQGQMVRQMPQQSLGTGFIIREDGLILTNNHVVDKADAIKVQLDEQKKESFDAKVIGKDARTDVALIKIEAKRKLPFVQLGSSNDVQVGEWVAAFGNPYGYGHTMTKGIISALGREIDELNTFPFMQTDASINPGNSGGPLVNTQGLVIGVNTAIDARAQGIGFVIPIDNVKAILPQLEKEGGIKRGFLGILMSDIDPEQAAALKIKQTEGALVTDVVPGSPAEKAGLEPLDLVVEFNGKGIKSSRDLMNAVAEAHIGQSTSAKVIRAGKNKTVTITIGNNPENALLAKRSGPRGQQGGNGEATVTDLGFMVADYSPALAREFRLPQMRQPHPIVVSVDPNSEASHSGLEPGDVILNVNPDEVSKSRDVIRKLKKGTVNILRVLKQDRVVLISLRVK